MCDVCDVCDFLCPECCCCKCTGCGVCEGCRQTFCECLCYEQAEEFDHLDNTERWVIVDEE